METKSIEKLVEILISDYAKLERAVALESFSTELNNESAAAFLEDKLEKANLLKELGRKARHQAQEYRKVYHGTGSSRDEIWEELGRIQTLLDILKKDNG